MRANYLITLASILFSIYTIPLLAQDGRRDQGYYQVDPPSYYRSTILEGIEDEAGEEEETRTYFKVKLDGMDLPLDPAKYEKVWHTNPVSQGQTGTCWCFSTTSFYESEVYRLTGKTVRLSEMYTVYWEYVERAKHFVKTRGDMFFGEGSETNAVGRMMKMYGIVPHESYTGLIPGKKWHTHKAMFAELKAYLEGVKERNAWNEKEVVATTKAILEHHMGVPPKTVAIAGRNITPLAYLEGPLSLKMDEYVNFMSLMEKPYYHTAEYDVPDNWWDSENYYNVPLDDFMSGLKAAVRKGYSVAIGGDVSEAGLVSNQGVAIVPTFDIPSAYIDENARQLRFVNGSTTDDHAMHLVGYREVDGKTWFLIKDSGSGSRNCGVGCKSFGYYFFHEDFIKLKMMNYTVHRSAVKKLVNKIN